MKHFKTVMKKKASLCAFLRENDYILELLSYFFTYMSEIWTWFPEN